MSRQWRRLGRRPPRLPASSAKTIVALQPPPSSYIIAIAFSLLGCDATMRTSAGEEGSASALAPASPVESELASAAAGGGGTRSLLWPLRGGGMIPPPPLAPDRRTSRRWQRRRWRRHQHGGKWGGRSCHRCLAFLVAGVVAQQNLVDGQNQVRRKARAELELREIEFGIYLWASRRTGTKNHAVWQSVGLNPLKILSPIFLRC